MELFSGIYNDEGIEKDIYMYINVKEVISYQTDVQINGVKYTCLVRRNTIKINNKYYCFLITLQNDETILIGKRKTSFFRSIMERLFPTIFKSVFFVVSNKVSNVN
jgi:hypothetical protein